jgi:hypothetical protein
VVGRNCRFLQGPGTDEAEVQRLRDAISADPPQPVTVTLLNYKKGGQPFWNALHVAPIRDAQVGGGGGGGGGGAGGGRRAGPGLSESLRCAALRCSALSAAPGWLILQQALS